ncbi:Mediator of RNA polymerase II transcription subunit 10 [Vanrija pseudolonga]|uniref:Mediator of RNA polymerase II transcription subunit 10 n=1 Tax=Vanrija pseudolonga TaxID=143232 RepID=A0AAF1BH43_9TREE|nr:Mediator of RNA polymerase II transcription subunit 10 [Vanrija pseudolonga]
MSLPSPAPSPYPGAQANGTGNTAAQQPTDQARLRAEIESQLLRLSQDLYEMEVCAGDVSQNMENAVPELLEKVNKGFINLQSMSAQLTDSVPRTIVDHVDRYKNPHQYTKTALSRATGENQYALGRVLGLESFRRQLSDAVTDAFPGIPLPERRHQPLPSSDLANGDDSFDQKPHASNGNGDVVMNELEEKMVEDEHNHIVPHAGPEPTGAEPRDGMDGIGY